jgi:hypothetical protein
MSRSFTLTADISSDDLLALAPVLEKLVEGRLSKTNDRLHVEAVMDGESARELNRLILSALRRVARRTQMRSTWTGDGITYRFFDYALKSTSPVE